MKSYPQSNVWPYVLSGVVLFCLVLTPPHEWWGLALTSKNLVSARFSQATIRHQQQYGTIKVARSRSPVPSPESCKWSPPKESDLLAISQNADSFPVFAGNASPVESSHTTMGQDASIATTNGGARHSTSFPVATTKTSATPAKAVARTQPSRDTRLPTAIPPATQSPSTPLPAEPMPAGDRYVWQPPPAWVATPIQPLDPSQMRSIVAPLATNASNLKNAAIMRVEPQPPVAKSVNRLPKSMLPPGRASRTQPRSGSASNERTLDPTDIATPPEQDGVPAFESPDLTPPASDTPESKTPKSGSRKFTENQSNSILKSRIRIPAVSPPFAPLAKEPLATGNWPHAQQLHALLATASETPLLAKWCEQIRLLLGNLEQQPMTGSVQQQRDLDALRRYLQRQVDQSRWTQTQRQMYGRVHFAAQRRADVWHPLLLAARDYDRVSQQSIKQLASTAKLLEGHLGITEEHAIWATHLNLSQIAELDLQDKVKATQVLENTLAKMTRNLSESQRKFLTRTPFRRLEWDTRNALASLVSPADVASSLEAYEAEPNRDHSAELLDQLRRWRSAPENQLYLPTLNLISGYYRNANIRVAVSEDLINRFVPAFHQYADQVNDTILGAAVRGRNATSTNLQIKLMPDPQSIRLGLLANGNVRSNTTSRKGPVTMYNRAQSVFSAGKELIVKPDGIFVTRTETRVTTGDQLMGLRSDLDSFPFIGWLVRNIARQQHDEQRPLVRQEVVRRVKRSAARKIDREVQQRLADVEQRINSRMLGPLQQMDLDPKAMEMRTTTDRVILRSRLASPLQLGSHTARPQARADSKMSLQIHQTAANNWIEQLSLQGRRMTLQELAAALSARFGLQVPIQNEDYLDTIVEFDAEHPLEFEFDNGQVTLTIHLAELKTENRQWKDFSVRGYYRADIQQLDVELVREQGIELISDKLRLRDQIALRSIFTKVFAKNTRLDLLRKAILQQPKLQSLLVTQFSIRDGWLAVSLGENQRGIRLVEDHQPELR